MDLYGPDTIDTIPNGTKANSEFLPVSIEPDQDDRLCLDNLDVSSKFFEFQTHVHNSTDNNGKILTVENSGQHLLALSSIPLLKPSLAHADLFQFVKNDVSDLIVMLKRLRAHEAQAAVAYRHVQHSVNND
ncbi:hypothetical protein F4703DRAFT_1935969 [Phycomyces blakesleeanus]